MSKFEEMMAIASGNVSAGNQQSTPVTQNGQSKFERMMAIASGETPQAATPEKSPAQGWAERAETTYNRLVRYYNGNYRAPEHAAAWGSNYNSYLDELIAEGQGYKGQYDAESESYIDEIIARLQEAQGEALKLPDYFGQFSGKEEYDFNRDVTKAASDEAAYGAFVKDTEADLERALEDSKGAFWNDLKQLFTWNGDTVRYEDTASGKKATLQDMESRSQRAKTVQEAAASLNQSKTDEAMREKYAGMDYYDIQAKLIAEKRNGSADAAWLQEHQYDDQFMSDDVYAKLIEDNERRLSEYMAANDTSANISALGASGTPSKEQRERERLQSEGEKLRARQYEFLNHQKYDTLPEEADFSALSIAGAGQAAGAERDSVYQFINRTPAEGAFSDYSPELGKAGSDVYRYISDDERVKYNYIYAKEGKAAADEYLSYISYDLSQRQADARYARIADFADNNFLTGTLASAASVLQSAGSGIGMADLVYQHAARAISGEYKPINYNTLSMQLGKSGAAARGSVSEAINDATGEIRISKAKNPVLYELLDGRGLGDIYQAGMSLADSLLLGKLVGPSAAGIILGSNAAIATAVDYAESGASDGQALMMGIISGTFEGLFEALSIEKLLSNPYGFVKSLGYGALTEGSEEFNTTLANTLADWLVMQDKSDVMTSYAKWMGQGYDKNQAFMMTLEEMGGAALWDGLMGAVSGMLGGGFRGASNDIYDSRTYKGTGTASPEAILSAAKTSVGETYAAAPAESGTPAAANEATADAKKKAQGAALDVAISDLESKVASGEKVTNKDIRRLKLATASTVKSTLASQAESSLKEKGIEDRELAEKIADAAVSGEKLSGVSKSQTEAAENVRKEVEASLLNQQESATLAAIKTAQQKFSKAERSSEGVGSKISVGELDGRITALTREGGTLLAVFESDGKTERVAIEDVSTDAGTDHLISALSLYHSAPEMFAAYEAGQDIEDFISAWETVESVYGALSDAKASDVGKGIKNILSEEQIETALKAGQKSAAAEAMGIAASEKAKKDGIELGGKRRKGTVSYGGAVIGGREYAAVNLKTLTDEESLQIAAVEKLAEVLGIDFIFYCSTVNKAGFYMQANGVYTGGAILIDVNSGKNNVNDISKVAILRTAAHELTHYIQDYAPTEYRKLQRFLFNNLLEYKGKSLDRLVQDKIDRSGGKLDPAAAADEVTADACEMMLKNSNVMEKLAKEDSSLANTIKRFLDGWVALVKEAMNGLSAQHAEAAFIIERSADEAQKLWDEGLYAAVRNAQKAEVSAKTADFSLRDKVEIGRITREELDKKPPVKVIDISKPKTTGTFHERRNKINEFAKEAMKKPYLNKDTGTMVFLTKDSYKHSFRNRGEAHINAAEHLPELIENAVLTYSAIPTHGSIYATRVYTFFAAVKYGDIKPVKLKIKEYSAQDRKLPDNIKEYFGNHPEEFASVYDSIVLEVSEIEESPYGSGLISQAKSLESESPQELSEIRVSDLLDLVKNEEAKKYVPTAKTADKSGEDMQEKVMLSERERDRDSETDARRLSEIESEVRGIYSQISIERDKLAAFDKKPYEGLLKVLDDKNKDEATVDAAVAAYAEWERESGYADSKKMLGDLQERLGQLQKEQRNIEKRMHEELIKRISKYDEDEVSKYVGKAIRKYHTTSILSRAAYLTTTGYMLDFSEGQGRRTKDHREISEILDLPDYAEHSDGLIAFMNMGNIRLQNYGIDVSTLPNSKQISALRKIIFKIMQEYDEFTVDFSQKNGDNAGSVTYYKGIATDRIISDIQSFFKTGIVPEMDDGIVKFRNGDYLLSEREFRPDERELLLGAAAEGLPGVIGEELDAYAKKVRAMEVRRRKTETLQAAWEEETDSVKKQAIRERLNKETESLMRAQKALEKMERTPDMQRMITRQAEKWAASSPEEVVKLTRALREENRELRSFLDYYKKQARLSPGDKRKVNHEDAFALAKRLLKEHDSISNKEEITKGLEYLGEYMLGDELDYAVIRERANDVAEEIISGVYETIDDEKELRESIKARLRGTRLRISGELRADIADFNMFRKANMGTITLANDGISIDMFYEDMRAEFGDSFFPPDVTAESDQLYQLIDVARHQLEPVSGPAYRGYIRVAVINELANEIIDSMLSPDVREENTLRDREVARTIQAATVNAANAREELRAERIDRAQIIKETVGKLYQRSEERKEMSQKRKNIDKAAKRLSRFITGMDKKIHVPETLKKNLGLYLLSLDTLSPRAEEKTRDFYAARLRALQTAVLKVINYQLGGGSVEDVGEGSFIDLPPDIAEKMERLAEASEAAGKTFSIYSMTLAELQDTEDLLSTISKAITEGNKALAAGRSARIDAEAAETVAYLDGQSALHKNRKIFDPNSPKIVKTLRKFWYGAADSMEKMLIWDNTTPAYFFARFGAAGERMYKSLTDGWGRFAFKAKEIMDFAKASYTAQQVQEAEADIHKFKLHYRIADSEAGTKAEGENAQPGLISEDTETVYITRAQMMSLYELYKREQGRGHLMAGGVKIGRIKGDSGNLDQSDHYVLTQEEVATICDELSAEDKLLADKLQRHMATVGSQWGNEVTMRRWGTREFTEMDYWPIKTDSTSGQVTDTEGRDEANLFRLLNMSFTKATTPNANNAVVLESAFDVHANHMTDMAKYNCLALPMLDAVKWFSYSDIAAADEDGRFTTVSLQKSSRRVYGDEGKKYFVQLLKDLNGSNEGGVDMEVPWSKLFRNYKIAAVAANLRVAFLQPTSYVRASVLIDAKYLAQGIPNAKRGIDKALKYSGTAVWKSLGYFDTNISKSLREQIKHTESTADKIRDAALKPAEFGDQITWGALWEACELETSERSGLTGEELMKATAERFDELIYKTQVMDSTLTRSSNMRKKGVFSRGLTSFMAEPTLSYNLLTDAAYNKFGAEYRRSGNVQEAWAAAKEPVTRAAVGYAATAIAASIVESIVDAMRDDDDYEEFWEKFLEAWMGYGKKNSFFESNLFSDLDLLSKIPAIKDVLSIMSGNSASRLDIDALATTWKAFGILKETIQLATGKLEEPTQTTYYGKKGTYGVLYNVMRALSQVSGIPASNALRAIATVWNFTVGAWTDKKWRTYEQSTSSAIKNAYLDGFLSDERAQELLVSEEVTDDEEKAKRTVYGWGLPGGEKWFSAVTNAVKAGDKAGFEAAVAELTEIGYSQNTVDGKVSDSVKEWYQGTDKEPESISKTEAVKMLTDYGGASGKDAEAIVQQWTCLKVTGIAYGDIKAAYIDGDISEADAVKMKVTYGGMRDNEALEAVQVWRCEKDTGIDYEELEAAYLEGEVSAEKAKKILVEYGGSTEENAQKSVNRWVFIGTDPNLQDITGTEVAAYNEYFPRGELDKKVYVDACNEIEKIYGDDLDGDGKNDTYTAMDKKLSYINTLPLTSAEKTALALAADIGSENNIRKRAPW